MVLTKKQRLLTQVEEEERVLISMIWAYLPSVKSALIEISDTKEGNELLNLILDIACMKEEVANET